MESEISGEKFLSAMRRVLWLTYSLGRTNPASKSERWIRLKLDRHLKSIEKEFGFKRQWISVLVRELQLEHDGEPVPYWLI